MYTRVVPLLGLLLCAAAASAAGTGAKPTAVRSAPAMPGGTAGSSQGYTSSDNPYAPGGKYDPYAAVTPAKAASPGSGSRLKKHGGGGGAGAMLGGNLAEAEALNGRMSIGGGMLSTTGISCGKAAAAGSNVRTTMENRMSQLPGSGCKSVTAQSGMHSSLLNRKGRAASLQQQQLQDLRHLPQ